MDALDINSDAIAATTLFYAMNTEEINGLRGKGNFRTVSPGAPDLNLTAD